MANRSTMAFAQAVAADTAAPAPGTVFLGQNPETHNMDATITRPTVDADGGPLTGLTTEYRMASRDPAFVQAVAEQNFDQASALASLNETATLTDADAGTTAVWSFPPGSTGAWYVAVAWADGATEA